MVLQQAFIRQEIATLQNCQPACPTMNNLLVSPGPHANMLHYFQSLEEHGRLVRTKGAAHWSSCTSSHSSCTHLRCAVSSCASSLRFLVGGLVITQLDSAQIFWLQASSLSQAAPAELQFQPWRRWFPSPAHARSQLSRRYMDRMVQTNRMVDPEMAVDLAHRGH